MSSVGSSTFTTWKRRVSAGSFSMYFLYSAQVVAAIVRSVPRASAGLSRLAASPVPAAPPAPISVCASSMNRMIGFGRRLHLVDHLAQAVLELALHARAGLQQAEVERAAATRPCSGGGTSPRAMPQREAFDDRGLADAGLAGEDRVVLAAAHQDVDDLADLLVAAGDRIDLALARLLGEVDREALERLLLAHLRRRHRAARLARRRQRRAVGGAERVLGRAVDDPREVLGQRVRLDCARTAARCASSALRSDGVFSMPTIRWPVRTCGSPNISVRVDPAALDRVLDVRRQIGDRGRAARQPVERVGDVLAPAATGRARSAGRCDAGRSPASAGSAGASAPARRTGLPRSLQNTVAPSIAL